MEDKTKIVMIDDEQDLCLIVKANLEQAGSFDVVVVNQAAEAVDTVKKELPDLVLLDVVMPGVKGDEIARVLKADPQTKHIPIVVISGKGEMVYNKKKEEFKWMPNNPIIAQTHPDLPAVKGAEALSEAYGVDDYISKPFTTDILLEVINEILARKRKSKKQDDDSATDM